MKTTLWALGTLAAFTTQTTYTYTHPTPNPLTRWLLGLACYTPAILYQTIHRKRP